MSKKLLIDASVPDETRVVMIGQKSKILDVDFDFSERKQLKSNIYLARITRVEPSLQAAFVDYGGNRHGFLPFSEIHPDYFQVPAADKERLMEQARENQEERSSKREEREERKSQRIARSETKSSGRRRPKAAVQPEVVQPEAVQLESSQPGTSDVANIADALDNELLNAALGNGDDAPSAEIPIFTTEDEQPSVAFFPGYEPDAYAVPSEAAETIGSNQTAESEQDGESGDDEAPKSIAAMVDLDARESSISDEDTPSSNDADDGEDEVDQDSLRLSHAFLSRHYKIQDVIKRRQIVLVQINKEERGNKGAALTTYLSLPGRYCVLMPNTPKGGGISRKITNQRDRKNLRKILDELNLPTSLSVIVRTAGSKQDKAEIGRDYDYLVRTWDQIRQTTLESKAPALVYEEGNIIKRAVRDMYTTDCDGVYVEGDAGFEVAQHMMRNLMPDMTDQVLKHDNPDEGLMHAHGVEAELEDLHKPNVALKSGGYLVINQTEALVAIDINSGKATRERSIEETAVKTNLEAADEIARQLRLRQMAGLVVVDFIDMEERRHNAQVERRMRDALDGDRARVQVGKISSFGLMELSRQRLGPSVHEIYRSTCETCGGLGHVRGNSAVIRAILRSVESAMLRDGVSKVRISCSPSMGMELLNNHRRALSELELKYGISAEVLLSPDLGHEDFQVDDGMGNQARHQATEEESKPKVRDDRRKKTTRQRGRTRDGEERAKPVEAEVQPEIETEDLDADEAAKRRRGKRGGRKRKGRDEGENAQVFALSFGSLLNTDRPVRDRRQPRRNSRGNDQQRPDRIQRSGGGRGRPQRFAENFDALLNTDRSPKDRRRGKPQGRTNQSAEPAAESQAQVDAATAALIQAQTPAPQTQVPQARFAQASEAQASETQASETQASEIQPTKPEAALRPAAVVTEPKQQAQEPVNAAPQEPEAPAKPKKKRKGWWSLG